MKNILLLVFFGIILVSCSGKDEIAQVIITHNCWSSDGSTKWARIVTWPDIDGGMPSQAIEDACKVIREAKEIK